METTDASMEMELLPSEKAYRKPAPPKVYNRPQDQPGFWVRLVVLYLSMATIGLIVWLLIITAMGTQESESLRKDLETSNLMNIVRYDIVVLSSTGACRTIGACLDALLKTKPAFYSDAHIRNDIFAPVYESVAIPPA